MFFAKKVIKDSEAFFIFLTDNGVQRHTDAASDPTATLYLSDCRFCESRVSLLISA
jgi:hypothetical protein